MAEAGWDIPPASQGNDTPSTTARRIAATAPARNSCRDMKTWYWQQDRQNRAESRFVAPHTEQPVATGLLGFAGLVGFKRLRGLAGLAQFRRHLLFRFSRLLGFIRLVGLSGLLGRIGPLRSTKSGHSSPHDAVVLAPGGFDSPDARWEDQPNGRGSLRVS
jgi:hypothetical protein